MSTKTDKATASTKYIDLISVGKDQIDREQKEFTAEEAKHSVDVAILETRKLISKTNKELTEAQRSEPYNLQKEIDLIIKIENLEKGLLIAKNIQSSRF